NSLVDLNSNYKNSCKHLIRNRCKLLYSSLGLNLADDENIVNYYTLINVADIAEELFDKEFAQWFRDNNKINDFLFALAKETGVVLMPGKGFGDTHPTLRVSLANLKEYQYEAIGKKTKQILKEFYSQYKNIK
ncbi:MAG: bifunctional aspartate transaminase/aspartate 4-decarboxylase, partial [Cetobacterium sp.]